MTCVAKQQTERPSALHDTATFAVPNAVVRLPLCQLLLGLVIVPLMSAAWTTQARAQATSVRHSTAQVEYTVQMRSHSLARATPSAGRYVAATGQGFTLGRSGTMTLLRFDNTNETWVLRPTSAPRGDTIYRNDAGEQVLRVTSSGGMTLYSSRSPGGSPVSEVGGIVANLEPQPLGPVQMFNLMTRRSSLVSNAIGRLVQINVSGDESEPLCVEALIVTTDAVIRIARSPSAKPFLNNLRVITIVEGTRSAVTYQRGELRIVVDPSRAAAGRPSSARIIRAIIPEN